jgi:hypothetical protein
MFGERSAGERVAPIVRIADNERGQLVRFAKQRMRQQVISLPVAFSLGQAQVPVHQVQRALGRLDHGQLSPSRLFAIQSQRNLVPPDKRPSRQNQIAVAARAEVDVALIEVRRRAKVLGQQFRLVVVPRPSDVLIDLLEADQVGVFQLDDFDDPLELVASIASANALMDVVTQ